MLNRPSKKQQMHVAQVTKKHHVQIATGLPRHNSSLLIALSEDRDQLKAPAISTAQQEHLGGSTGDDHAFSNCRPRAGFYLQEWRHRTGVFKLQKQECRESLQSGGSGSW